MQHTAPSPQVSGGRWVSFRLAKDGYRRDRTQQGFQLVSFNVRKVVLFLEKDGFIEIYRGFNYPREPGKISRMKAADKLKEVISGIETETDSTGMPLAIVKGKKDKDGNRKILKTPVPPAMLENMALINSFDFNLLKVISVIPSSFRIEYMAMITSSYPISFIRTPSTS